jgi:hypothetical protein
MKTIRHLMSPTPNRVEGKSGGASHAAATGPQKEPPHRERSLRKDLRNKNLRTPASVISRKNSHLPARENVPWMSAGFCLFLSMSLGLRQ